MNPKFRRSTLRILNTNYANKREFRSIDPKRKRTYGREHRVPSAAEPQPKKGVRSQEIARTRRSQETIFGENSEIRTLYPYTLPLNPNAFENARGATSFSGTVSQRHRVRNAEELGLGFKASGIYWKKTDERLRAVAHPSD